MESQTLSSQINCRICLDDEGHFIRPCLCNGSLAFVHESCLMGWITHSGKSKYCPNCLSRYNDSVKVGNPVILHLIPYPWVTKTTNFFMWLYLIFLFVDCAATLNKDLHDRHKFVLLDEYFKWGSQNSQLVFYLSLLPYFSLCAWLIARTQSWTFITRILFQLTDLELFIALFQSVWIIAFGFRVGKLSEFNGIHIFFLNLALFPYQYDRLAHILRVLAEE